ncbi:MAG: YceI family protein [Saprospiraceae bacterium]|nr:YceI family protein [Saprospiraceae bacterium]
MKKVILGLAFVANMLPAFSQKYFTKEGTVSFHSHTNMEKIEAVNNKATSVVDFATGAMEWGVLIKAFRFEKALMQEHFNENYMESSKYPKATFKGKIENITEVKIDKDGTYPVMLKGNLDIHGVSKPVTAKGTIIVKGGKISGSSKIRVLLANYKIDIPSLVKDNIAKEVDIEITADYLAFK